MARKKTRTADNSASGDQIAVYAFLLLQRKDVQKREKLKTDALIKEMGQNHVAAKEIERAIKALERPATEMQAEMEVHAHYLTSLGAQVQLEMFETLRPRRNDPVAEARARGRNDAILHRVEIDSPYPAGSPEGQAWLEGHRDLHDLVAQYERRFEIADAEAPEAAMTP